MVNSGSCGSEGGRGSNEADFVQDSSATTGSSQSPSPITASSATTLGHKDLDASDPLDCTTSSTASDLNGSSGCTSCTTEVTTSPSSSSSSSSAAEGTPPGGPSAGGLFCSVPLDKVQAILSACKSTPGLGADGVATPDTAKVKTVKNCSRKTLCLYCDRTFVSSVLRQKHVERCHSAKQFRRVSSRRHQNSFTSTTCVYCDKLTATEHTLQELFEHLVSSHPGKYFGCLPCQERFLSPALLTDHNASNHPTARTATSSVLDATPTDPPQNCTGATSTPVPPKTAVRETTQAEDPEDEEEQEEDEEEEEEEIPVKITRSKLKPKIDDDPAAVGETPTKPKKGPRKMDSSKLQTKELRTKKLALKSSKLVLKRSKRLQAKVVVNPQKRKRRGKGGDKVKGDRTDQVTSTKGGEKAAKSSTAGSSINPYPEFDSFFRVKKITDHSIDNLKISSLTFDDVFDKAFFNRIRCNIQENLLHHIDGKLFKNEESESRISNFEKVSTAAQEVQSSNSDNYGCEISLNAVTPAASLLSSSQFGEDFESQIEYGSKPSKKKAAQTKKDEVHYKYFTRRKYQASILEHKENRDLSRLDMWTQFVIQNRQQRIVDDKKSPEETLEYAATEEYKNKRKREELNRILDRRGPFEDLREEANKQAALDKLSSEGEAADAVDGHDSSEIKDLLNDMLSKVFAMTDDITMISPSPSSSSSTAALCAAPPRDDDASQGARRDQRGGSTSELPSYLKLRRTSSLPSDGEIDRSDKIALICSSQETENFELPTNTVRDKNEKVELTGEWARSRIYVCAACGLKLQNTKQLLEHKSIYHQNVWAQHYEFVGNQSALYRHLSIPGLGKVGVLEDNAQCKLWKRSESRVCTKCGKQCNSLGELHRHILECGGDWTWMLARKKCKYRPFGAKSRRKRRGLIKRRIFSQKTEPSEKKVYKKQFDGPRPKPSDAETIQRMLANLPPKRATRKLVSLKDGLTRKSRQNPAQQQTKMKCGKVIHKVKFSEKGQKHAGNVSMSMNKNHKNHNYRRSLRSLNKVLASRILDTNSTLRVKRKLKNLNCGRAGRLTRRTVTEAASSAETASDVAEGIEASVSKKDSGNSAKGSAKEDENRPKRTSPRTEKNAAPVPAESVVEEVVEPPVIAATPKVVTEKLNIKQFFNIRKKNSSQMAADGEGGGSEVRKGKTKRKSAAAAAEEVIEKPEGSSSKAVATEGDSSANNAANNKLKNEKNTKKKKSALSSLVKTLRLRKKKDDPSPQKETGGEVAVGKKRKLKDGVKSAVKKLKKSTKSEESEQPPVLAVPALSPKPAEIASAPFLDKPEAEQDTGPPELEKIIVIPAVVPEETQSVASTIDQSTPVPTVVDQSSSNADSNVTGTTFDLQTNDEKTLQAEGELNNFDEDVPVQIKIEAEDESVISPKPAAMVSPRPKPKIKKPARGLNDCIAMLTSKLSSKVPEEPPAPVDSIFNLMPSLTPEIDVFNEKPVEKPPISHSSSCILKVPHVKDYFRFPTSDDNDTVLDLSSHSRRHAPEETFTKVRDPRDMLPRLDLAISLDDKTKTIANLQEILPPSLTIELVQPCQKPNIIPQPPEIIPPENSTKRPYGVPPKTTISPIETRSETSQWLHESDESLYNSYEETPALAKGKQSPVAEIWAQMLAEVLQKEPTLPKRRATKKPRKSKTGPFNAAVDNITVTAVANAAAPLDFLKTPSQGDLRREEAANISPLLFADLENEPAFMETKTARRTRKTPRKPVRSFIETNFDGPDIVTVERIEASSAKTLPDAEDLSCRLPNTQLETKEAGNAGITNDEVQNLPLVPEVLHETQAKADLPSRLDTVNVEAAVQKSDDAERTLLAVLLEPKEGLATADDKLVENIEQLKVLKTTPKKRKTSPKKKRQPRKAKALLETHFDSAIESTAVERSSDVETSELLLKKSTDPTISILAQMLSITAEASSQETAIEQTKSIEDAGTGQIVPTESVEANDSGFFNKSGALEPEKDLNEPGLLPENKTSTTTKDSVDSSFSAETAANDSGLSSKSTSGQETEEVFIQTPILEVAPSKKRASRGRKTTKSSTKTAVNLPKSDEVAIVEGGEHSEIESQLLNRSDIQEPDKITVDTKKNQGRKAKSKATNRSRKGKSRVEPNLDGVASATNEQVDEAVVPALSGVTEMDVVEKEPPLLLETKTKRKTSRTRKTVEEDVDIIDGTLDIAGLFDKPDVEGSVKEVEAFVEPEPPLPLEPKTKRKTSRTRKTIQIPAQNAEDTLVSELSSHPVVENAARDGDNFIEPEPPLLPQAKAKRKTSRTRKAIEVASEITDDTLQPNPENPAEDENQAVEKETALLLEAKSISEEVAQIPDDVLASGLSKKSNSEEGLLEPEPSLIPETRSKRTTSRTRKTQEEPVKVPEDTPASELLKQPTIEDKGKAGYDFEEPEVPLQSEMKSKRKTSRTRKTAEEAVEVPDDGSISEFLNEQDKEISVGTEENSTQPEALVVPETKPKRKSSRTRKTAEETVEVTDDCTISELLKERDEEISFGNEDSFIQPEALVVPETKSKRKTSRTRKTAQVDVQVTDDTLVHGLLDQQSVEESIRSEEGFKEPEPLLPLDTKAKRKTSRTRQTSEESAEIASMDTSSSELLNLLDVDNMEVNEEKKPPLRLQTKAKRKTSRSRKTFEKSADTDDTLTSGLSNDCPVDRTSKDDEDSTTISTTNTFEEAAQEVVGDTIAFGLSDQPSIENTMRNEQDLIEPEPSLQFEVKGRRNTSRTRKTSEESVEKINVTLDFDLLEQPTVGNALRSETDFIEPELPLMLEAKTKRKTSRTRKPLEEAIEKTDGTLSSGPFDQLNVENTTRNEAEVIEPQPPLLLESKTKRKTSRTRKALEETVEKTDETLSSGLFDQLSIEGSTRNEEDTVVPEPALLLEANENRKPMEEAVENLADALVSEPFDQSDIETAVRNDGDFIEPEPPLQLEAKAKRKTSRTRKTLEEPAEKVDGILSLRLLDQPNIENTITNEEEVTIPEPPPSLLETKTKRKTSGTRKTVEKIDYFDQLNVARTEEDFTEPEPCSLPEQKAKRKTSRTRKTVEEAVEKPDDIPVPGLFDQPNAESSIVNEEGVIEPELPLLLETKTKRKTSRTRKTLEEAVNKTDDTLLSGLVDQPNVDNAVENKEDPIELEPPILLETKTKRKTSRTKKAPEEPVEVPDYTTASGFLDETNPENTTRTEESFTEPDPVVLEFKTKEKTSRANKTVEAIDNATTCELFNQLNAENAIRNDEGFAKPESPLLLKTKTKRKPSRTRKILDEPVEITDNTLASGLLDQPSEQNAIRAEEDLLGAEPALLLETKTRRNTSKTRKTVEEPVEVTDNTPTAGLLGQENIESTMRNEEGLIEPEAALLLEPKMRKNRSKTRSTFEEPAQEMDDTLLIELLNPNVKNMAEKDEHFTEVEGSLPLEIETARDTNEAEKTAFEEAVQITDDALASELFNKQNIDNMAGREDTLVQEKPQTKTKRKTSRTRKTVEEAVEITDDSVASGLITEPNIEDIAKEQGLIEMEAPFTKAKKKTSRARKTLEGAVKTTDDTLAFGLFDHPNIEDTTNEKYVTEKEPPLLLKNKTKRKTSKTRVRPKEAVKIFNDTLVSELSNKPNGENAAIQTQIIVHLEYEPALLETKTAKRKSKKAAKNDQDFIEINFDGSCKEIVPELLSIPHEKTSQGEEPAARISVSPLMFSELENEPALLETKSITVTPEIAEKQVIPPVDSDDDELPLAALLKSSSKESEEAPVFLHEDQKELQQDFDGSKYQEEVGNLQPAEVVVEKRTKKHKKSKSSKRKSSLPRIKLSKEIDRLLEKTLSKHARANTEKTTKESAVNLVDEDNEDIPLSKCVVAASKPMDAGKKKSETLPEAVVEDPISKKSDEEESNKSKLVATVEKPLEGKIVEPVLGTVTAFGMPPEFYAPFQRFIPKQSYAVYETVGRATVFNEIGEKLNVAPSLSTFSIGSESGQKPQKKKAAKKRKSKKREKVEPLFHPFVASTPEASDRVEVNSRSGPTVEDLDSGAPGEATASVSTTDEVAEGSAASVEIVDEIFPKPNKKRLSSAKRKPTKRSVGEETTVLLEPAESEATIEVEDPYALVTAEVSVTIERLEPETLLSYTNPRPSGEERISFAEEEEEAAASITESCSEILNISASTESTEVLKGDSIEEAHLVVVPDRSVDDDELCEDDLPLKAFSSNSRKEASSCGDGSTVELFAVAKVPDDSALKAFEFSENDEAASELHVSEVIKEKPLSKKQQKKNRKASSKRKTNKRDVSEVSDSSFSALEEPPVEPASERLVPEQVESRTNTKTDDTDEVGPTPFMIACGVKTLTNKVSFIHRRINNRSFCNRFEERFAPPEPSAVLPEHAAKVVNVTEASSVELVSAEKPKAQKKRSSGKRKSTKRTDILPEAPAAVDKATEDEPLRISELFGDPEVEQDKSEVVQQETSPEIKTFQVPKIVRTKKSKGHKRKASHKRKADQLDSSSTEVEEEAQPPRAAEELSFESNISSTDEAAAALQVAIEAADGISNSEASLLNLAKKALKKQKHAKRSKSKKKKTIDVASEPAVLPAENEAPVEDLDKSFNSITEKSLSDMSLESLGVVETLSDFELSNVHTPPIEAKDSSKNNGEIKENFEEATVEANGRRRTTRNAKAKALESILDEALSELTESERNREIYEKTTKKGESAAEEEERNARELRRSKRNSNRVTSYDESELADPLLQVLATEGALAVEESVQNKPAVKDPSEVLEPRFNSDELFDLLKATPNENIVLAKPSSNFFGNFDEISNDFNDDNFDVFENMLNKSIAVIEENLAADKNVTVLDMELEEDVEEPEYLEELNKYNDPPREDGVVPEISGDTTEDIEQHLNQQKSQEILLGEELESKLYDLEEKSVNTSSSSAAAVAAASLPDKLGLEPEVEASLPDTSSSFMPSSESNTGTPKLPNSVESTPKKVEVVKKTRIRSKNPSDKVIYCEICDRSFCRSDNLVKHKRTLTHISRLSEIEAAHSKAREKLDAAEVLIDEEVAQDVQEKLGEFVADSIDNIAASDSVDDVFAAETSELEQPCQKLKLVDIISDVLNKPDVIKDDDHQEDTNTNSFSDIILQNSNSEAQKPSARRYKSLGERKSFEGDTAQAQQAAKDVVDSSTSATSKTSDYFDSTQISKTAGTILEKQLTLLQNMIENRSGLAYIDDVSASSSLSAAEIRSSKQEDSNIVFPNRADEEMFLKPSQYEEISEDSTNLAEHQKSRKVLNRDEELFLECCSLLKSGSEVSNYSSKKSNKLYKALNSLEQKSADWLLQNKNQKVFENIEDCSDDVSRIPTPLGDNFGDNSNNSNTISSGWDISNEASPFRKNDRKISETSKSFSFEEVLSDHDDAKLLQSKFGGIQNFITDAFDSFNKRLETKPAFKEKDPDSPRPSSATIKESIADSSKKMLTKGAMKVFEGLKVSIPTEELNMKEVLTGSSSGKASAPTPPVAAEPALTPTATPSPPPKKNSATSSKSARKSKPTKNRSQFDKFVFKVHKKKAVARTAKVFSRGQQQQQHQREEQGDKIPDIYDFEETQDNSDVFTKPDFKAFRTKSKAALQQGGDAADSLNPNDGDNDSDDNDSRECVDSLSVMDMSDSASSFSDLPAAKRPKTQERRNMTKKKCVIMGRIFSKNATKSKLDEYIRDIPLADNAQLVEDFIMSCPGEAVALAPGPNDLPKKPKMTEEEMNLAFDRLISGDSGLEDKKTPAAAQPPKQQQQSQQQQQPPQTDVPIMKKPLPPANHPHHHRPVSRSSSGGGGNSGSSNKRLSKVRPKKRARCNSDSTDDEFGLEQIAKKRNHRRRDRAEDNCINLEQELKECIGVASRKSQRKCTSGKQNVLVEYWSSDESSFETTLQLLEQQQQSKQQSQNKTHHSKERQQKSHKSGKAPSEQKEKAAPQIPPAEPPKQDTHHNQQQQQQHGSPVETLNIAIPLELIEEPRVIQKGGQSSATTVAAGAVASDANAKDTSTEEPSSEESPAKEAASTRRSAVTSSSSSSAAATNRRKRAAANPLYHWSSSSEDESSDFIIVKPARDEPEDDEDRPIQHGWIVGDSPKKLVTMLAQAKGKKCDVDTVKEQGGKRRGSSHASFS